VDPLQYIGAATVRKQAEELVGLVPGPHRLRDSRPEHHRGR
jgi:hypothetical protein